MTVTREDLNPCTVKLTIACEPDEIKDGFDKAIKHISKNIRLPGFRPGHAPRSMVEPLIGANDLNAEAADIIVRKAATKAIDQESLKPDPSQRMTFDLMKLDRDKPEFEFSIKVGLPPIVDIGEYKGLEFAKREVEVSDEEVDYQLELMRNRRQTRTAVTDRGVEEGDVAVVNVKLEGGEGEGRTFMTVAGQTFPEFDQALIGMKVEEMKQVNLTFPENFQEKDWAGKKHSCVITLNTISAVTLPELDEVAKSMKTESVDELKTRLREAITAAKNESMRDEVNEELLDKLLARSTVHLPDNMWEDLAKRRLHETAEDQRRQGKTMEDYAKDVGMTLEELSDEWMEKARTHVKRALLIREVYTREKMTLTNQELNRELLAMAQEHELSPEDLVNILKKNNQMEELTFRSFARKVSDFLRENASVKEMAKA